MACPDLFNRSRLDAFFLRTNPNGGQSVVVPLGKSRPLSPKVVTIGGDSLTAGAAGGGGNGNTGGGDSPQGGESSGGGGDSSGGGGPDLQLNFTMQTQMQDEWCWAAVTVSISVFYSPISPWTQCSLVCDQVADPDCCQDGSTKSCDQPWQLDLALTRTQNLQSWTAGSLGGSDIQTELAANRALACRIGWSDNTGHFVAISGYQNDGSVETVVVDDPIWGRSQITLDQFTNSYRNDGTWTHSYYTKS